MKSFTQTLLSLLLLGTSLAAAASLFGEVDDERTLFEKRSLLDKRTMTWGDLNYTQDYTIEYSTSHWKNVGTANSMSATEAFCRELHDICVDYNGPLGYHHVIDCVPTQAGPQVKAFCGGRKKRADGTWSSHTSVRDVTRAALAAYSGEAKAWVKGKPVGAAKCRAFVKKNPR